MPDKDVNIHIKAPGADKAKLEVDAVGQSLEQWKKYAEHVGVAAKQTTEENTGFLASIKRLSRTLAGLLAAGAGLIQFFRDWAAAAREARAAQADLANSTKTLDDAAKGLASQAGLMGTPGGMEAARSQVARIQMGGKVSDFGQAGAIATAAHTAFGQIGSLLTPEQEAIATVVADLSQRKDLSGEQAGQVLKLLADMGAGTADDAKQAIQQLIAVHEGSGIGFGAFVGLAGGAVNKQQALGASREFALASFRAALEIDKTGEVGDKQVALLQNEDVIKAVARDLQMPAATFRDLPYDQRMAALGAWVQKNASTGTGQRRLAKAGLSGGQATRALALYSPELAAKRQGFLQAAQGATSQQFDVEATGYGGTVQGYIDQMEAERAAMMASASEAERMGMAVMEQVDAEWTQKMARGEIPKDYMAPPTPFVGAEGEKLAAKLYYVWYQSMNRRLYRLPRTAARDALGRKITMPHAGHPMSLFVPNIPSPAEIGELELMMRGEEESHGERARVATAEAMRPIQYIYDHSSHYQPVAGSREDRGIGPRTTGLQGD